jgi:PHD/YefM family antitoxin component YafN of YafNO toxin-antitoxin module
VPGARFSKEMLSQKERGEATKKDILISRSGRPKHICTHICTYILYRERETERDRETETETERDRDRERQRERETKRERRRRRKKNKYSFAQEIKKYRITARFPGHNPLLDPNCFWNISL